MKNKYVIYTVLVGGYDDILQPAVIDERFDYILFSNDFDTDKIGVWNIRHIPLMIENDNKRLSRYPKTHPETLLSEYEASLYIDANIQIMDQWVYDRFVEFYESDTIFAGVKLVLTGRDCIYDHAFDMSNGFCVEHDYIALKQCHTLFNLGFPAHFGLNENNVIFRIHNEKMRCVDEDWWTWIQNSSSRDQLSYMYCLWHHNIPITYFLPVGEDARNGKHFSMVYHDRKTNVIKTKVVKRSIAEKIRCRISSMDKRNGLQNWNKSYKSKNPVMTWHLLSIKTIILYTINFIRRKI